MTLTIGYYNNYYNRKIKKCGDKGVDYYDFMTSPIYFTNMNFNPNDGVTTEIVIGKNNGEGTQWDKTAPDYLVVADGTTDDIVSRWFIMDLVRTRGGQYKLSLKRDLIVDYYDNVVNAPCYIEKGWVGNENPLIFNKEAFTCNQIKKSEQLLFDGTYCSWIVLYFSQAAIADGKLSGQITSNEESYIDLDVPTITDWTMITRYGTNGYKAPFIQSASVYIDAKGTTDECLTMIEPLSTGGLHVWSKAMNNDISNQSELEYTTSSGVSAAGEAAKTCVLSNETNILNQIKALGREQDTLESLMAYNGKLVKTNDNKYWRISIVESGMGQNYENLTTGPLYNALTAAFMSGGVFKSGWAGSFTKALYSNVQYKRYNIQYTQETNGILTYAYDFSHTADSNAVTLLNDQPFGIIALPYKTAFPGKVPGFDNAGFTAIPTDMNLLIARDLCQKGFGPDKYILDAQILPYCPCPTLNGVTMTNGVMLNPWSYVEQSEYVANINDGEHLLGFALLPKSCKFTRDIWISIPTPDNLKLSNQVDVYRIVSPNYNGQFEFSVAKNRGVQYFNIDCTYKPYQPYIHVNPAFGGLYGQDFDDARGLICGGDFSMTVVTDAWENYKLQNKNYQEIFNRQIQSLDKTNELALYEQAWSMGAGAVQGAAAGAVVGSIIPGVGTAIGAGIGAVGGAGLSLLGGNIDRDIMKQRQQEQRDYTIDMHEYQLGNIKALPDSLAKVDSYNNNNKMFPFLEMYSCTDEEKEAFNNMITYQGMTIGVIGKIFDYLRAGNETFIKGQLIRLPDIKEDAHVAYSIYEEINKGVYI